MDLAIVASRRPDLLRATLDSFAARVFAHLPVERVVANIDPIFGGPDEHAACVALIRGHFPTRRSSRRRRPASPPR